MSNAITVYGNSGVVNITVANTTQPSGGIIYPPNVTPGTPTGPGTGGGPGGIGTGDGGFDTPSDATITTPSITFPNPGNNTGINDGDTATSSTFAATGARTHAASRWMIVYVGAEEDAVENSLLPPSPTYLFDSGPDTVNLTTLPFSGLEFEHSSEYRIRVRYKASGGNWSNWSQDQVFFTEACQVDPDLYVHFDMQDPAGYTQVGAEVTELANLGTLVTDGVPSGDGAGDYSVLLFPYGAVEVDEYQGYELDPLTFGGGGGSIFMVCTLGTAGADDIAIGISNGTGLLPEITFDSFTVRAGVGDTCTVYAVLGGTDYTYGPNLYPADTRLLVELHSNNTDEWSIWLNGTELDSGATAVPLPGMDRLCAFNSADLIKSRGDIGEFRYYQPTMMSAADAAALRIELAAKWGVTF